MERLMSEEVKSTSEQKKEDWMNSKWRPMMGWMYMVVCMMDFVIFPILWSLLQAMNHGRVETQWSPITLQGAGLFHMAMGAVLGVTAWSRGQEKIAGVNNGGLSVAGPTPTFNAPVTNNSYVNSSNIATPTSSGWSNAHTLSTGGKLIVPPSSQPEI
jgi:hypothetical protein